MQLEDIPIPEGFQYTIHSAMGWVCVFNTKTNLQASREIKDCCGPTDALLQCIDEINIKLDEDF